MRRPVPWALTAPWVPRAVLDEIVGFGFVAENPLANTPDRKSIAAKEQGERVTIPYLNPPEKGCVVQSSRTLWRNSPGLIAFKS